MAEPGREERTYLHLTCEGQTAVSGMSLVYVANIFHHPDRTHCGVCDDAFPMHEFTWADTGESLTDYYSRYAGQFEGLDRFYAAGTLGYVLMAGGLLAGGTAGVAGGLRWGLWAGVGIAVAVALSTAFAGFVVGAVARSRVCRRVLGTDTFSDLD